jgi:fermentation-respiration switch protein FrsA (DUF1100 family)
MNFHPFSDIETISPRPMLFITGDVAHSREFSEDAFRLAAEPKELVIVPGVGHIDLYDRVNLTLGTSSNRSSVGTSAPRQASEPRRAVESLAVGHQTAKRPVTA